MSRRLGLVLTFPLCALLGACASTPAPTGPVPNIAGSYVGEFNPSYPTFDTSMLPSSLAHVRLQQQGRDVTGSFSALGLSGDITGRLDGNQLTGNLDGQTDTTAGNARFDAKVDGDTLQAILDNNPLTLKRIEPRQAVAMQNPRTKQVILCQGSPAAISGCAQGLGKDGWKRLNE